MVHFLLLLMDTQFLKIGGCPTCALLLIGQANSKQKPKLKDVTTVSKKDRLLNIIGTDTVIDTEELFLNFSSKIHGTSFNYTKSTFISLGKSITIQCNKCLRSFNMTPYRHLYLGKGCKFCNHQSVYTKDYYNSRGLSDFPCMLYLLQFTSETESFIKVGLTKQTINKRFKGKDYHNYTITVLDTMVGMFFDLVDKEQLIIKKYSSYKYIPLEKFKGYSECFSLLLIKQMSTLSEMLK